MRSLGRRRRAPGAGDRARAQADLLIRDGRRLDAIDAPHGREPRVAATTTSSANSSACATSRSTISTRPPARRRGRPIAPDLFTGVDGLPEISAAELTADALRSGIVRHGALIVRGFVPPERVERLITDIDRTFVARDAFFDGAPVAETAPWYVPFEPESGNAAIGPIRKWVREGGGVLTVESPRSMFDVLDTFEAVGFAEPLAGYLGRATSARREEVDAAQGAARHHRRLAPRRRVPRRGRPRDQRVARALRTAVTTRSGSRHRRRPPRRAGAEGHRRCVVRLVGRRSGRAGLGRRRADRAARSSRPATRSCSTT